MIEIVILGLILAFVLGTLTGLLAASLMVAASRADRGPGPIPAPPGISAEEAARRLGLTAETLARRGLRIAPLHADDDPLDLRPAPQDRP